MPGQGDDFNPYQAPEAPIGLPPRKAADAKPATGFTITESLVIISIFLILIAFLGPFRSQRHGPRGSTPSDATFAILAPWLLIGIPVAIMTVIAFRSSRKRFGQWRVRRRDRNSMRPGEQGDRRAVGVEEAGLVEPFVKVLDHGADGLAQGKEAGTLGVEVVHLEDQAGRIARTF